MSQNGDVPSSQQSGLRWEILVCDYVYMKQIHVAQPRSIYSFKTGGKKQMQEGKWAEGRRCGQSGDSREYQPWRRTEIPGFSKHMIFFFFFLM